MRGKLNGLEGGDGAETPPDMVRPQDGQDGQGGGCAVATALRLFCDRLSDDPDDYPDRQLWEMMQETRRTGLNALAECGARTGGGCKCSAQKREAITMECGNELKDGEAARAGAQECCGNNDVNVVSEWLGEDENGVGWWRLADVCVKCGSEISHRLER